MTTPWPDGWADEPEEIAAADEAVVAAEKAVLAAMLTSRQAAEELLGVLDGEDCFAVTAHRVVYSAVAHQVEQGEPSDMPAVLARIVSAEAGGWRTGNAGVWLADLLPHYTASWSFHAQAVLRAAARRRLGLALARSRQLIAAPDGDVAPDEAAGRIRDWVDEAVATRHAAPPVTAGSLYLTAVARLDSPEPPGVIVFPWAQLRALVPYLRPGQLVTVLGRPGLGKSMLGQDLARYTALTRRIPCALFTAEQGRDEVMDRLLAAEAGVPHEHITGGRDALTEDDWARIRDAKDRFDGAPLVIDDTARPSLAHVRARLRGMRADPAQLAVVDYVQLMAPPAGCENRQQEVSALVSGLKAIARELAIPVVMLCQLNRGPEHRAGNRPHLSDARESGAVENDSDVAILIHRPDYYDRDARPGEADLLVDKNRNGRTGVATVGFQGRYARLVDLAWFPTDVLAT